MKTEFEVGRILKPRGLKGEMKIELFTSNPDRLKKLKQLKIADKCFAVEKFNLDGNFAFIKLGMVDNIDDAESLRNKTIVADRAMLPDLDKDEFYISDIIGFSVFVDGEFLGQLEDVLQYSRTDIFVVKTANSHVSFPSLRQVVTDINIEKSEILVDKAEFDKVAVFD